MKNLLQTILLLSFLSGSLLSQEIVPSTEKKEADYASKSYDASNLSTREARAITKFQILTGFGGDTGGFGGHVTFGTLLKRDVILEARVAFPIGVEDDKEPFFFGSIGAKLFTGNTFFFKPSLYYASGDNYGDNNAQAAAGGLQLNIGNEWRVSKNFVVGADWLGIGANLVEFDGKAPDINARFLVFNLGYAF